MAFEPHFRLDQCGPSHWECAADGTTFGTRGTKGFRHMMPTAQHDWIKEDVSGTSALSYVFDSATSRLVARLNPSATGTHKLRKRIYIPRDYGLSPSNCFALVVQRSGSVTSIKATLLANGTADSTINGSSVSPVASSTFEAFTFTPGSDYNAGQWATVEIEYVSSTIGVTVDIADFEWMYKTDLGNIG